MWRRKKGGGFSHVLLLLIKVCILSAVELAFAFAAYPSLTSAIAFFMSEEHDDAVSRIWDFIPVVHLSILVWHVHDTLPHSGYHHSHFQQTYM